MRLVKHGKHGGGFPIAQSGFQRRGVNRFTGRKRTQRHTQIAGKRPAGQAIWKRSKIDLIRPAASSVACSGVMFFCVILASAWLQICSDNTAE